MQNKALTSLLKILDDEKPEQVPVSIWNTRGSTGFPEGVNKIRDYYDNADLKLQTQLFPLSKFDDILLIPGVWPDFGVALEASAFGCDVTYRDNNPPVALPFMKNITEVNRLTAINPQKDGLMPVALEQYKKMLEMLPGVALAKLDYLDGCSLTTGPLEVSSMILGHTNFYTSFVMNPKLAKTLLEVVTDGIIDWLKALEKISGKTKFLSMIEHLPGQISADHFEEFGKPYIKRIFESFPDAIKLYHNEDDVSHVADQLHEMSINIYHFGDIGNKSREEFKSLFKGKVVLMGNIHPLDVLLSGSSADVTKESQKCIDELFPDLILSSGGGLTSGTPLENLQAMVNAGKNALQ